MNREIEFRAWDNKSRIMIHGNNGLMIFVTSGVLAWQFADELNILESYTKQNRYKLMQFTGLKDNTGKKIFEGDIVKTNEAAWIAEVIWGRDGWICNDRDGGFATHCDWEHYEIIGNIYENSKLLK